MPLVHSSVIKHISYDQDRTEVYVTFNSGASYTYLRVPEQVYEDWLAAASIGEYFNEHIRDQYECVRRG